MLERAAMALNKALGPYPWDSQQSGFGSHRDDMRDAARAVIESLMEPTEDVVLAAMKPYLGADTEEFDDLFARGIKSYWQAMLRKILE